MFTHKNAHTDYIKFIERFRILKRRKSLERLHCMSKDIFEHDNSTSSVSTGRQEEKNNGVGAARSLVFFVDILYR
jgi:hypothetical protein